MEDSDPENSDYVDSDMDSEASDDVPWGEILGTLFQNTLTGSSMELGMLLEQIPTTPKIPMVPSIPSWVLLQLVEKDPLDVYTETPGTKEDVANVLTRLDQACLSSNGISDMWRHVQVSLGSNLNAVKTVIEIATALTVPSLSTTRGSDLRYLDGEIQSQMVAFIPLLLCDDGSRMIACRHFFDQASTERETIRIDGFIMQGKGLLVHPASVTCRQLAARRAYKQEVVHLITEKSFRAEDRGKNWRMKRDGSMSSMRKSHTRQGAYTSDFVNIPADLKLPQQCPNCCDTVEFWINACQADNGKGCDYGRHLCTTCTEKLWLADKTRSEFCICCRRPNPKSTLRRFRSRIAPTKYVAPDH